MTKELLKENKGLSYQMVKAKQYIMKTQNVCGLCGQEVNFEIKAPDPMSATVDHIIPLAKGGHPTDYNNLQLAHRTCNRKKSDKIFSMQEINLPLQKRLLPNNPSSYTYEW
jgi:5-methylcytosine-specific restriction endonuclease McrA